MCARLKGFSFLHLFRRNYLRAESCCEVEGNDEKGTSAMIDDALAAGSPGHFDFRAHPHDNVIVYERDLLEWRCQLTRILFGRLTRAALVMTKCVKSWRSIGSEVWLARSFRCGFCESVE